MKQSASMKALAGLLGIFFLAGFAIFSITHFATLTYAASHCDAGSGVALCDALGSTLASFASAIASSIPQFFALILLAFGVLALALLELGSRSLALRTVFGPAPPHDRMPASCAHEMQYLFARGILNTKAY